MPAVVAAVAVAVVVPVVRSAVPLARPLRSVCDRVSLALVVVVRDVADPVPSTKAAVPVPAGVAATGVAVAVAVPPKTVLPAALLTSCTTVGFAKSDEMSDGAVSPASTAEATMAMKDGFVSRAERADVPIMFAADETYPPRPASIFQAITMCIRFFSVFYRLHSA